MVDLKNVTTLSQCDKAMSNLMIKEAKTYKCFFTNEEFEKNKGDIWDITRKRREITEIKHEE